MDKTQMLNDIQAHYKCKNDSEFAAFLDIKPQVLSNWKSRNTFNAEVLYTKCLDISPEWLLTGQGYMLKAEAMSNNMRIALGLTGEKPKRSEIEYEEIIKSLQDLIIFQRIKIQQLEEELQQRENIQH